MTIRFATRPDLDAIVEIYNQAIAAGRQTGHLTPFAVDKRVDWFLDHPAETYPILVAEEEGAVIGYLSISPYRPGRMALRYTAEVSYYVHEGQRRKGIASQLLTHALSLCPALQIRTLFAILFESNRASAALLEKHGFAKWGFLPKVADFDGVEVGQFYYGLRVEDGP